MNSIVCLKEVPDPEARIEVRTGKVVEEGIQYVVNPYDEFALEEALRWQEEMRRQGFADAFVVAADQGR